MKVALSDSIKERFEATKLPAPTALLVKVVKLDVEAGTVELDFIVDGGEEEFLHLVKTEVALREGDTLTIANIRNAFLTIRFV